MPEPDSTAPRLTPRSFDERTVQQVLDGMIPDPGEQSRILTIMSESLERANRLKTAGWSLSISQRPARLRLNVGALFSLELVDGIVRVVAMPDRIDESARLELERLAVETKSNPFRTMPEVSWFGFEHSNLASAWPLLRDSHQHALQRGLSGSEARTPAYHAHSPTALKVVAHLVGRNLPEPAYGARELSEGAIQGLLERVQARYSGWASFRDPKFEGDEREYKIRAVARMQELLSEPKMRALIDEGKYVEVVDRLDKVGKHNNLLFRSVPTQGDLRILYVDGLDKAGLASAMYDLLYGDGDSTTRLADWLDWLEESGLQRFWTFPTYFLFLTWPNLDVFVKPTIAEKFLQAVAPHSKLASKPDPGVYGEILDLFGQLEVALERFGPRDMIDLQSFVWVAVQDDNTKKPGAPGDELDHRQGKKVPDQAPRVPTPPLEPKPDDLTLDAVSAATGIAVPTLHNWINAIDRKKQAIFYGPPGTGKTFIANHLAKYLAGRDGGFSELVQFHPSYGYEDFIQGIRPDVTEDGALTYDMVPGRFLDFCRRASETNGTCVLVVDEINRANLSQVFGELMYLLEYRGDEVPLAGGGSLRIPDDVRILGTMNTADRSIALVDHALRRRFAFVELRPMYDVLRKFHAGTGYPVDGLIEVLQQVNSRIGDPHYEVGISFFMDQGLGDHIETIWRTEIEPYLVEYFFDQPDQADALRWDEVCDRLRS